MSFKNHFEKNVLFTLINVEQNAQHRYGLHKGLHDTYLTFRKDDFLESTC